MAEIFPDEGLDWLLGIATGNTAAPTNLYLGMFTSQTGSTVPARGAVLATQTGVTEAAFTNYARITIAPGDWGAASTNGNGRVRTAAQKSFAAVGASGETVTGFFIATTSGVGTGVAVFYANFDDTTANTLTTGDTQKITPSMQFDG
jgi:hypothetical protein